MRGTTGRGGTEPEPPESCFDGDPSRFDAPLLPAFEPEAGRAPSAELATVVPTPGQGRTRKRGNGKRASSAQAAANVEERAAPARPSPASASSAPMTPPSAAGCRVTADQVEPEDGNEEERGSNAGTVGRAPAGGAALVSWASGDRPSAHVDSCVAVDGGAMVTAIPFSGARGDAPPAVPVTTRGAPIPRIATDSDAAVGGPPPPTVTIAAAGDAAEPADAPRRPVPGAEAPVSETTACVRRAGLEPIAAETPLRFATLASTVPVAATGSAGDAETEAEATGVETVALGFEPTATVAVTEVWPGAGTAADTDTVGVVAVGVEREGVVTDGVETLGTETVGVVTAGVETVGVGTETVGVVTVGVVTLTVGVVTVGVPTDGVETVGLATVGVATLGVVARGDVVTLPPASAAPAIPPHANNTSAAADEALRRRAPLISDS
jgi:hypothetical protein